MPNPPPRPSPDAADVCAELREWAALSEDQATRAGYPEPFKLAAVTLRGAIAAMRSAASEIARLRALVAGGEWVACADRLPERGKIVLLSGGDPIPCIGYWLDGAWRSPSGGALTFSEHMTHYRPLPPAPSRVGVESRP